MGLKEKIEGLFTAVAFAEAGEHETARQLLKESKEREKSAKAGPVQPPGGLQPEAD